MQKLWFESVYREAGGLSKRQLAIPMRIVGALKIDVLRHSLQIIVCRHEALRTRFVSDTDGPRQQIDDAHVTDLEVIDLRRSSRISAERETRRQSEAFIAKDIDLCVGPLFAARLFILNNKEQVLILALDHIITDGISNVIIFRELWSIYQQLVLGSPWSLVPVPLQFGDYAVWRQNMSEFLREEHESYWTSRLAEAPKIMLPRDAGVQQAQNPVEARLRLAFGVGLSARLRDLAQRERTLLPLVILTAYVTVMSRWCRQEDILLIFVSNARGRPELQNVVGFLANIVCLRVAVRQQDRLIDLLRRVDLEFRAAQEHQDFDRVIDLVPEGTTELGFNWLPDYWGQNMTHDVIAADAGLRIEPFWIASVPPRPAFSPWFSKSEAGIALTVEYRSDLFATRTIEWFGYSLRLCAEELTRCPHTQVSCLSIKD
jgi:hypothetical protein